MKLPGGVVATPYSVKCYATGCRRVKRGYLTTDRSPGGAFYDKRGNKLADLREQEFCCSDHGGDREMPFLYPDHPMAWKPPKKRKDGPVVHDPTLRTKGGTPKRSRTPTPRRKRTSQTPPKEVTFGTLVVREVEPRDRRHHPAGLTALHDWDLPYYLQLVAVASDTKVGKTVRIGITQSGHDVLMDLDFGGRVLGIEVV